jgi:hypothetical protein
MAGGSGKVVLREITGFDKNGKAQFGETIGEFGDMDQAYKAMKDANKPGEYGITDTNDPRIGAVYEVPKDGGRIIRHTHTMNLNGEAGLHRPDKFQPTVKVVPPSPTNPARSGMTGKFNESGAQPPGVPKAKSQILDFKIPDGDEVHLMVTKTPGGKFEIRPFDPQTGEAGPPIKTGDASTGPGNGLAIIPVNGMMLVIDENLSGDKAALGPDANSMIVGQARSPSPVANQQEPVAPKRPTMQMGGGM